MYDGDSGKMYRYLIALFLSFLAGAFILTGVRGCLRGRDGSDTSAGLEAISDGLDDIEDGLRRAEEDIAGLGSALQSAAGDAGEIREQVEAIGGGIERVGESGTAIEQSIERIDRFIEKTNRANGLP
jgi:chromosome segregation ATPase